MMNEMQGVVMSSSAAFRGGSNCMHGAAAYAWPLSQGHTHTDAVAAGRSTPLRLLRRQRSRRGPCRGRALAGRVGAAVQRGR